MENSFGAKVTQPDSSTVLQSYFISIENSSPLERKNQDIMKIKSLPVQIMMIDPNLQFILLVTTDPIADQIRTLPTIKMAGAVNIDFDRFRSMVDGSIIKQQPKTKIENKT